MNITWDDSRLRLKPEFPGFRQAEHKHHFNESKPYSTPPYERLSILTLGTFVSAQCPFLFSLSVKKKGFFFSI